MMRGVRRPLQISTSVRWWPSTLYQTTTLEVVRDDTRLLVDPGVSPWEIAEAAGEHVGHVLLTHADWDHVMGIGQLADATVHASAGTAERIRSGEARRDVEKYAAEFYVPVLGLDRLRVDVVIDPPAEGQIGPWSARFLPAPGHTRDGMATWLPEERLLIVGDHLSGLEVPFIEHSAWGYRENLQRLLGLIEAERPEWIAIGHGPPIEPDEARRVGQEDLAYIERLNAFAEAGGDSKQVDEVAHPQRGGSNDAVAHADNLDKACLIAAAR
jgi:glyoxylase-like metal-dependent hydrolase (beta-lactamase superfamily II)